VEFRKEDVECQVFHAYCSAYAVVRDLVERESSLLQVAAVVIGRNVQAEVYILAEVQERVGSGKSVDSLASNAQAAGEAAEAVDIERGVGSAVFNTTVVVL
jgi:hypothetical protein